MRILLINSMSGVGSTGRIVDGIADILLAKGHEAIIAYGYGNAVHSHARRFGYNSEQFIHKCLSHAFDMQGYGSLFATKNLIDYIKEFKPDIINIHTIHGNYLNFQLLFSFLKEYDVRIVWTLHDCWTFTGHCPHFEYEGCYKWKTECNHCTQLWMYPTSKLFDGSRRNFKLKKKFFTSVKDKLTIISVSDWLGSYVKESFFSEVDVRTIRNGINLEKFKPSTISEIEIVRQKYCIPSDKKVVLAVASPWTERKGWKDIQMLASRIPEDFQIVIVGITKEQGDKLPANIIGIQRTESVSELQALYSCAYVFINPTYEDCYPTVNLESLACGTPIISYNTGGSPECFDSTTGMVVAQGSVDAMANAIVSLGKERGSYSTTQCRNYAERNCSDKLAFSKYVDLFEELTIGRIKK